MDFDQIGIKIVLIVGLLLVAIPILLPGRGSRAQALTRIAWLLGVVGGIIAVLFPEITQSVADWLGVARGTDLVLYMLIVFFAGFSISSMRTVRENRRMITSLARRIALLEADLRKRNYVPEPVVNDRETSSQ